MSVMMMNAGASIAPSIVRRQAFAKAESSQNRGQA